MRRTSRWTSSSFNALRPSLTTTPLLTQLFGGARRGVAAAILQRDRIGAALNLDVAYPAMLLQFIEKHEKRHVAGQVAFGRPRRDHRRDFLGAAHDRAHH